jgi:hypothetical protein
MGRVLLTSSQVSVLVTFGIGRSSATSPRLSQCLTGSNRQTVLFFTTALFLSGFAIQQRTLRQLRISIKQPPRPSPKTYLPDRFKATTTELEDGTIIVLESEVEREAREQEQILIEVRPTIPEKERLETVVEEPEPGYEAVAEEDVAVSERERNVLQQKEKTQSHPDPVVDDQKPISRAQRRKLIKEEIRRLSHQDQPVYYQRRLY